MAKAGLRRFMTLTSVIIMRIVFRRSLDCIRILVKKRGFVRTFIGPYDIVVHACGLSFTKNAFSPRRNAHSSAGRGRTLGPPRLFYRSLGCRLCWGGVMIGG